MPVAVTACGFFGKLPSRGDFVRAGLPRSFTDLWDAWLREVLPASRAILGEEWIPAWLQAPVWRFALPSGVCGPDRVLGLWMPSMDSAGRYFPLVMARTGGEGELLDEDFLSVAEEVGRVAIADDWPPDELTKRLATPSDPASPSPPLGGGEGRDEVGRSLQLPPLESPTSNLSAPGGGEELRGNAVPRGSHTLWWTEGSPCRPACRLVSAGLPCGSTFACMLDQRRADAHADPLPRQRGE